MGLCFVDPSDRGHGRYLVVLTFPHAKDMPHAAAESWSRLGLPSCGVDPTATQMVRLADDLARTAVRLVPRGALAKRVDSSPCEHGRDNEEPRVLPSTRNRERARPRSVRYEAARRGRLPPRPARGREFRPLDGNGRRLDLFR